MKLLSIGCEGYKPFRERAGIDLRHLEDDVRDGVLTSHSISPDRTMLERGDREAFLTRRRDDLIRLETDHMKREGVVPPPDLSPQAAAIDTE